MEEDYITTLVLIRHLEHFDNILLPDEILRGIEIGKLMDDLGLRPSVFVSSPQPRAKDTAIFVQCGACGKVELPIECYPELGTLDDGAFTYTRDDVENMLCKSRQWGVNSYTLLAHVPVFDGERMKARGIEGAECLREILRRHHGETICAASHSGSRMEHVIAEFIGLPATKVPLFANGEFAVLGFRSKRFRGQFRCASFRRYRLED